MEGLRTWSSFFLHCRAAKDNEPPIVDKKRQKLERIATGSAESIIESPTFGIKRMNLVGNKAKQIQTYKQRNCKVGL